MSAADDDSKKAPEADLAKAVGDLKKSETAEKRFDMPADPSPGHLNGKPEERLPPDDDEN